jgi:hypothetical protein
MKIPIGVNRTRWVLPPLVWTVCLLTGEPTACLASIEEGQLDRRGFRLIRQNRIDEAIAVFKNGVEEMPDSWQLWDSLGEAYMYSGNRDLSMQAYEKSLEINPDNRNALKKLRNLDEYMLGMSLETREVAEYAPGENTGISAPYFGQTPPGLTPQVFAPGLVSTRGNLEYSCSFSPSGKEMYFCANVGKYRVALFYSRREPEGWTAPQTPEFSRGHLDFLPYIMPDSGTVFFGRIVKNANGETIERGTYVLEASSTKPRPFPEAQDWMHVSATRELTVYTTFLGNHKTARFPRIGEGYPIREATAGDLHPGAHPAISPDEEYVVFDSERDGGVGLADLYVCFREDDGSWSQAVNLGAGVNSPDNESIPHITHDGRYLFYTMHRDVYWVSTDFVNALRP